MASLVVSVTILHRCAGVPSRGEEQAGCSDARLDAIRKGGGEGAGNTSRRGKMTCNDHPQCDQPERGERRGGLWLDSLREVMH